jgi:hypothetical protein
MTAQNGFLAAPTQLDGHAGSLDIVADELSAVAGQLQDTLADQPLGAFAQFLVAGLQTAMGEVATAITHAVSTSDELSAGMRHTAEDYRRVEDGAATTFREDVL